MVMREASRDSAVGATGQMQESSLVSMVGARVRNELGQRLDLMTELPPLQSTEQNVQRSDATIIAMPGVVLDALGIPRGYLSAEGGSDEVSKFQHGDLWREDEDINHPEGTCGGDEVLIKGEGDSGIIFFHPLPSYEIQRMIPAGPSVDFSEDKGIYKTKE